MDFPTIRGISLTLNQRQNQIISRRTGSFSMPAQAYSARSEYRRQVETTNKLSTRRQPLKVFSTKSMTLLEFKRALDEWKDPDDDAQDVEAKQRITDCFKQRSDSLDLSFLSLTTLPDVIGRMQHIHYLSIANNYFSEIPQILTKLTVLKLLNMSYNILNEVSDSIKDFKQLEFFNAECNQLSTISEELVRLPKIQTIMLSHNRIMKLPENIHHIKDVQFDDQVPMASFGNFSSEFARQWEETFQNEPLSGYLEIWVARYEEILRLPKMTTCCDTLKTRIGILLDTMIKHPNLRPLCYEKACEVVATCHDGILFSLFEMEIKQIEEKMIAGQLSDEEVREEVERFFNFTRLKELAVLHTHEHPSRLATTTEQAQTAAEIETIETILFFYISSENTLEMPSDNGERLRFMTYPELTQATHQDVKNAVAQIRREKNELGQDYLINFVSDKESWVNYLEGRYANIIAEHTHIFMEQMEHLETKIDTMDEYDYLMRANAIAEEKKNSEQRLYYQLTKNIVAD